MSQWTQQVRENSPFNQVTISSIPAQVSAPLATSARKISNSDSQGCGQNLDFEANITPTKKHGGESSISGVVIDSKSDSLLAENISGGKRTTNGDSNGCMQNKDIDLSIRHTNKSKTLMVVDNKPIVSKSGNPPSRKKKIKRVPLMTISNHAKPNWEEKSDFLTGKSSPTDKLDVASFDAKFCDRFGGNSINSDSKSGLIENSSDKCLRDSFKVLSISHSDSSSVPNGFGNRETKAPVIGVKRQTPQKCNLVNGTKSTPDNFPQTPDNVSRGSGSVNKIPTRRVSLQPAKPNDPLQQENGFSGSFTTDTNCPLLSSSESSMNTSKGTSVLPTRRVSLTPAKTSDNAGRASLTPAKTSDNVGRVPLAPAKTSDNVGRVPLTPAKTSDNVSRVPLTPAKTSDNVGRVPLTPAKTSDKAGRVSLTPVKTSDTIATMPLTFTNGSLHEITPEKTSENNVSMDRLEDELSDTKKRERILVHNVAEVSSSAI